METLIIVIFVVLGVTAINAFKDRKKNKSNWDQKPWHEEDPATFEEWITKTNATKPTPKARGMNRPRTRK